MNPDDALLVERYRDDALSGDERVALDARLQRDPAFLQSFVAEVRLGGLIAAVASTAREAPGRPAEAHLGAEDGRGVARHARFAPRRARAADRSAPLWIAAAACLAVAAISVYFSERGGSSAGFAALVAVSDGVEIRHDGRASAATPAQSLRPGDEIAIRDGGSAEVRFADGTDVVLAGGTDAGLRDGSERGIALDRGSLTAEVAKQAPGTTMSFSTSDAQALVIGTRLGLEITPEGTRLHVTEGRVAFAARTSGHLDVAHGIVVAAGESALARGGRATVLPAPTASAAQAAVEATAADAADRDSAALARAIAPSQAELAWLSVGWDTDLWHARRRAQAEGKPILLWAGWGDPLGAASSECLSDRTNLWSDAAIQALARDRFIPVAVDSWFLSRRADAVGRFFLQVQARAEHRTDIPEGILCCTADGRLLSSVPCGSDRERTMEALAQALRAAAPAAGAQASADSELVDAALDPHPPADALVALIEARHVLIRGGGYAAAPAGQPGREVLWLPGSAWRALLPVAPKVGSHAAVPEAVVGLIARNALVDTTAGECAIWERAYVHAARMESEVAAASPTVVRLRLRGDAELSDGRCSYAPRLSGIIEYDPGQRRILRVELTAIGPWQAPGGAAPAGDQLGIAIVLADDAARMAHPHGARSEDAMTP